MHFVEDVRSGNGVSGGFTVEIACVIFGLHAPVDVECAADFVEL
jgi:hypothetical protein